MTPTIEQFMTSGVHTIGSNQPLAVAHQIMREHGVRHLPVLERGEIVGVVSQRDLYFLETLQAVDPNEVEVLEAMTQEPYVVGIDTALVEAARVMKERKLGCAVIMRGDDVAGIFTTTDALRALADLLAAAEIAEIAEIAAPRAPRPRARKKTRAKPAAAPRKKPLRKPGRKAG